MPEQQVLYLTTTGRVTGLPRQIEIWYVSSGRKLYLLAEHFHKAHWVQNIAANPRVKVRLDGREFDATARALDPERDRQIWDLAQDLAQKKYGWGDGLPVEITQEEQLTIDD